MRLFSLSSSIRGIACHLALLQTRCAMLLHSIGAILRDRGTRRRASFLLCRDLLMTLAGDSPLSLTGRVLLR